MNRQIPLTASSIADRPHLEDGTNEVANDLAYRRIAMVNVVFWGEPGCGDGRWVLIDTGLPGFAGRIQRAASERFGPRSRPAAIILTHGHSDHVGCVEKLATKWETAVYAHPLEIPYLNGSASYPPPDTGVGGGVMPLLAPLFPRGPVDLGPWLHVLPEDGSVPGMPDWRWVHTPGHAPGHISLHREKDDALIVGDAFITTNQESAYAVAMQTEEMHGPPKYFTPDWQAAEKSVQRLADLEPELVITGHGRAMRGPAMRTALRTLATDFQRMAVPPDGRYVHAPARADDGSAYVDRVDRSSKVE